MFEKTLNPSNEEVIDTNLKKLDIEFVAILMQNNSRTHIWQWSYEKCIYFGILILSLFSPYNITNKKYMKL